MFVEGKKCTQHLKTVNLKAKESVMMRLALSRKKNTINNKHNIQKTWFITYCFISNVFYYGSKCRDWGCPYWPAVPFKIKEKRKRKRKTLNCHGQHSHNLASETDDILPPHSSTIQKCWLVYSQKTELTFANLKPMWLVLVKPVC